MAGHFEAIGVTDIQGFIEEAARDGEWAPMRAGGRRMIWRDPSGASLAARTNEGNELVCASPSFAARSRVAVRLESVFEHEQCRFCSAVQLDVVEGGYPIACELENIDEFLDRTAPDAEGMLALTAFAEEVSTWPDEQTYEATPSSPRLAVRSLIPSGLFTGAADGVRAEAVLTGLVEAIEELRNEATGGSFVHALVATLDATVDCVLAPADLPDGLAPGNVVQGTFWLIGRLSPA